MTLSAFEELKWRGLIYDYVDGVQDLLATQPVTIYNGFDATADSLHVGHMVPLIALARLQRFGHHPIALAGGGTSMIGDPAGKTSERQLLTDEQVAYNVEAIKGQLAHFLDFENKSNPARLMNNSDWLMSLNLVEFLRDVGKHFTVNQMVAKEAVKNRLEREDGISFTEFSYMLLQSYDYLHLYEHENCLLQTGGSDQWGNITAGVELIRRVHKVPVFGMVYPLITKADGTKFGKTESGSVWLSPERTSPYRFYQFWLNTEDQDVISYLKIFTFLDEETIEELESAVENQPDQREAQYRLAEELTGMMHGETALAQAKQASQELFGAAIEGLSADAIEDIFAEVPSSEVPADQLGGQGMSVVDLFSQSGLTTSKGEARRLINSGGAYVNNRRIRDINETVGIIDSVEGRYLVLRKGRKSYLLVRVLR
jgi:tyrosyl-tRNA synthetase